MVLPKSKQLNVLDVVTKGQILHFPKAKVFTSSEFTFFKMLLQNATHFTTHSLPTHSLPTEQCSKLVPNNLIYIVTNQTMNKHCQLTRSN